MEYLDMSATRPTSSSSRTAAGAASPSDSHEKANAPASPDDRGQVRLDEGPVPVRNGRIGWIVAGSLATGVVAALLLAAAPFIQVQENDITGAVLCGFALGWAMLAVLSVRFTDQP